LSGICLIAGLLIAPFGEAITLRWTHSVPMNGSASPGPSGMA